MAAIQCAVSGFAAVETRISANLHGRQFLWKVNNSAKTNFVRNSFNQSKIGAKRISTFSASASSELAAEPVTIDNSTVLVVGGGGVGMEVLRQAATAGSWVTAFQRGEKFRAEIEGLGSMLAIGDVNEPDTIAKALRSNTFDAVVVTVGGGMHNIQTDSDGVINVIKAAKEAGIDRFLLVTSIGTGNSAGAISEQTMSVLGPVLREKAKAEEFLQASGLKWTIIRPGGLQSEEKTGNGFLTEDSSVAGLITRKDVATLILKVLFNDAAIGKIFSAIDSEKLFPPAVAENIAKFL